MTPPTLQGSEPREAAGRPRVAVIIPCFNHGRFVADAVRSALAQQDAEVQVVVVNDGSNDGETPGQCDACRALDPERIQVLHQANAGLPAARNRGADEARRLAGCSAAAGVGWEGEENDAEGLRYLVFLDADDWIEPTFVAKLHAALLAEGAAAAGLDAGAPSHAYCQERLVELGTGIWQVPEWDPLLLMITNLHPVTALVRADSFFAVGGFDESMRGGYEDWDLWLRFASRSWRGVRVREPLFIWRRHSHATMVIDSVRRHDELFSALVANHRDMYLRHAERLLILSNTLLRRADANWLDESLEAIPIRDQRNWIRDLVREREDARAEVARLTAALAALEGKPAIRISKALHRFLDRLPAPLAGPARGLLRTVKRAAPPARG